MSREQTDPTSTRESIPGLSLREAALKYAAQGLRVFPLRPRDKRPLTRHGHLEATSDPEQVDRWWTAKPEANIGIANGDGLLVIDVDAGSEGEAALAELESEIGRLPTTRTATTGNGMHLYFRSSETIRRKIALANHVDVLADGGYVVAPPSVHPNGDTYSWLSDVPSAALPHKWTERLQVDTQRDRGLLLTGEAPLPVGVRDDVLFSMARSMAEDGIGEASIIAALKAIPLEAATDFGDKDYTRLARGALRYGRGATIVAVGSAKRAEREEQARAAVPSFQTAADFGASVPEATTWVWEPYIAAGDLVELDAKPKVGKSTLGFHLTKALTTGIDFLGAPVADTDVVWLSEMAGDVLREGLEECGVLDNPRLHLLMLHNCSKLSWSARAALAVAECVRVNARLLVIDTAHAWFQIRDDKGNASGTWPEKLEELAVLKAHGTAVLLNHWERRSGGSVGDSGLGSTTLAGTVDTILKLTKIDPKSPHRRLEGVGRHSDTPDDVVIDLTDDGYVLVGEGKGAVRNAIADRLRDLMSEGDGWTLDKLALRCPDVSKRTVLNALNGLVRREQVRKTDGRRGGPNGSVPATYHRIGVITRVATEKGNGNVHIPSLSVGRNKQRKKATETGRETEGDERSVAPTKAPF